MGRSIRCCTLGCDLKGDLRSQIVDVDENDPALRDYDSLETVERCVAAFELGLGHGLLQVGLGEVSSRLPPALGWSREWMKAVVTHWLLALRVNPRARLDPPPGLLEAWTRMAHRVPELKRLRVDSLRRQWHSQQQGAEKQIAESGMSLAKRLSRMHSLWPYVGNVVFRVEATSGNVALPFTLNVLYVDGISPSSHVRTAPIHGPIFGDNRVPGLGEHLLDVLETAAMRSAVVRRLLDSQEIFSLNGLIPRDTHALLLDAPALEAVGIDFRVPAWWEQRKPPRLGVRTRLGSSSPTPLSGAGLLDVHTTYVVDECELSVPEWLKFVAESVDGLVKVGDQWYVVDHQRIQQAMVKWRASEELRAAGTVSFAAAMTTLETRTVDARGDGLSDVTEQISAGPWLARSLNAVKRRELLDEFDPGAELEVPLRPYQREGVSWLVLRLALGHGALLADDMGLGKTCQIIALLLGLRRRGDAGPHLLVVPASLIGNWRDEMRKFARSVPFTIVHRGFGDERDVDAGGIVITSYATLLRRPALRQRDWGLVVLDEAQAIKNASAKVTRTLKSLSTRYRVALTGTPVENHPGELWSILDFLNPGEFGTMNGFLERWRRSREDPAGLEELRSSIRVFMLRRLKSDPSLAPELPAKVEVTAYCGVTATQSNLYCQALLGVGPRLRSAAGGPRKDFVTNLITRLKQICDHPALYLDDGNFDAGSSGKFQRLQRICETIAAAGEKVLVFTQFQTLTTALEAHLRRVFGRPGLILDGTTAVNRRSEIVAEFQDDNGPPFMVLTLKAGGSGLNLTAATHVVHFDLWWNPATEAQATDRAHRIGQKRQVMVHRMVCRGTLEEGINDILRIKREVAEDLLAPEDEEVALTRMGDDELLRVLSLDQVRALGTGDVEEEP